MYNTAARTTVMATSRIVAMIGDTARRLLRRHRGLGIIFALTFSFEDLLPAKETTSRFGYKNLGAD
jgi:hypothetical protein